jgi:hypothetical protein
LSIFPRERLLIGFHEEIGRNPAALVDRVCEFIGVAPFPDALRPLLAARVNSSARGAAAPIAVHRYVAERYEREMELLAQLAGGPAERWLDQIRAILRQA